MFSQVSTLSIIECKYVCTDKIQPVNHCIVTSGLLAHGAILSALYERTISGLGQRVDTSLMEAQLSSLVNVASNYLISGKDTSKRLGTGHPSIVPYQSFECKGGKYLSLAVGNDGQFRDLCKALGRAKWSRDMRFLTNSDRVRNRSVLIAMLEEIFKSESVEHWLEAFENKGFPCGPVRSIEEAFNCPQALERNMVEEIDHPKCGPIKVVGVPVKYSRTPCGVRTPPPLLGEHTKHILMDILEFSEAEVMDFVKNGVVSTATPGS